ncbi:hypothetical protein ABZV80_45940 [Streptomyces sp. NPDC005132]|uniref:hypothetical protein n=1 Tax=Streptomyces sp. NPDC005132 TaxID=3154294 RepID=UPI0033BAE4EA
MLLAVPARDNRDRFGEYSTHELGIQPDAYEPKLAVDFTPLREQALTADGLGQAA